MTELIPPGKYRARAVDAGLAWTGGLAEEVVVEFALLDYDGVTRPWYGFFTEASIENTFKSLRAAGWKGQDLSDLSDLTGDDTPEVTVVIQHETDLKGNLRDKIRYVNSSGGLAIKKRMTDDEAVAFAARMRGAIAAHDQQSAGGATPAQNRQAPRPAPTQARRRAAVAAQTPQAVPGQRAVAEASYEEDDSDLPF